MKILVAGDWHSELHEEAVFQAFKSLGHEVFKFGWHHYFKPEVKTFWRDIDEFTRKFQNKFVIGPLIRRLNRDFYDLVDRHQPDLIFVYRGTHITKASLQRIKRRYPATVLAGYNNDDPFADGHPYWLWRHFLRAIPIYDMVLAYRHRNLDDFLRAGAKRVHLLRSWFAPLRNHPVRLTPEDEREYGCDVVFVGHYEADERLGYLEEVVRQGFRLRLFGPGYDWDPVIEQSAELKSHAPVRLVWGEQYNKALCGAKVALCFFSRLNRDTYTRRCFEIPATGTLMLSEYSDDLASLYREGEEADFFSSKQELIEKLSMYLRDDKLRQTIAANGYRRVIADGHDVVSRMKQVLEWAVAITLEESPSGV